VCVCLYSPTRSSSTARVWIVVLIGSVAHCSNCDLLRGLFDSSRVYPPLRRNESFVGREGRKEGMKDSNLPVSVSFFSFIFTRLNKGQDDED